MTESHKSDGQEKDDLLEKITSRLDAATDEIDAATKTRLRAIRREALASAETSSHSAWWVPAGSLAAVATLAVMTVSLWTLMPEQDAFMPPLEDIALLSDKEELEFYEELDFYLWLNNEQMQNENTSNEQKTG